MLHNTLFQDQELKKILGGVPIPLPFKNLRSATVFCSTDVGSVSWKTT